MTTADEYWRAAADVTDLPPRQPVDLTAGEGDPPRVVSTLDTWDTWLALIFLLGWAAVSGLAIAAVIGALL